MPSAVHIHLVLRPAWTWVDGVGQFAMLQGGCKTNCTSWSQWLIKQYYKQTLWHPPTIIDCCKAHRPAMPTFMQNTPKIANTVCTCWKKLARAYLAAEDPFASPLGDQLWISLGQHSSHTAAATSQLKRSQLVQVHQHI